MYNTMIACSDTMEYDTVRYRVDTIGANSTMGYDNSTTEGPFDREYDKCDVVSVM